jgi:carbonic anhydrase
MKLRIALAFAAALPFAAYAGEKPAEKHANPHAAHPAPHWSYEGDTGPAKWGKLEKEFGTCAMGKAQSPIDITTAKAGKSSLGAIAFAYQPTSLKVIDNGHTVQANVDGGSSISIGGQTYELKQFHFHRPSEEKIDGKSYELVAHMVHKSADGKLAVVAVLFKQGAENALLQKIWNAVPRETGKEVAAEGVSFNPADLLPAKHSYYNFSGSLTTPPCSEGVNWFVLNTPVEASRVQIARFGAMYPMNARPTQPVNHRAVQLGGE